MNQVMRVDRKSEFLTWVVDPATAQKSEVTRYGVFFDSPRVDEHKDIQHNFKGETLAGYALILENRTEWERYTVGEYYAIQAPQLVNQSDRQQWQSEFDRLRQQVDSITNETGELVLSGSGSGSSGSSSGSGSTT